MSVELTSLTTQERLDLGGALGMIKISSVAISSPVLYFDLALPVGYDAFVVFLSSINAPVTGLSASVAIGGQFANDPVNSDTYSLSVINQPGEGTSNNSTISGFWFPHSDALMQFGDNGLNDALMLIYPGDSSHAPRVYSLAGYTQWPVVDAILEINLNSFNPNAVVPPTLGRYDLIRFQPYGNDDADPPTSTDTLTGGSASLFGIPTPA